MVWGDVPEGREVLDAVLGHGGDKGDGARDDAADEQGILGHTSATALPGREHETAHQLPGSARGVSTEGSASGRGTHAGSSVAASTTFQPAFSPSSHCLPSGVASTPCP